MSCYDLTWPGDILTIYNIGFIKKCIFNFKQPTGKQTFGKKLVDKMR